MEDVITENGKLNCIECKNNVKLSGEEKKEDVVECGFCGIEYEVGEKTPNDELKLRIVEEEK